MVVVVVVVAVVVGKFVGVVREVGRRKRRISKKA